MIFVAYGSESSFRVVSSPKLSVVVCTDTLTLLISCDEAVPVLVSAGARRILKGIPAPLR